MNEQIKKLRKVLNLTQQDFADRLGTTRNNIAGYETGRRTPSIAVINLICREFNVSETWLRTGEGEMFIQRSRTDELSFFVDQLLQSEPDNIRRRFVMAISRLSTKELEILEKIALRLADELNTAAVPAEPEQVADLREPEAGPRAERPAWEWTDAEIEAELEDYRAELLAERAAAANPSASPDTKEA